MKLFAMVAMTALLAACAANTPRKDAYAEAAKAKRTEIARLGAKIDSLRLLPQAEGVQAKIDSLQRIKTIEEAGLAGIGGAARMVRESNDTVMLFEAVDREKDAQEKNRKHPIK